jgi:molybdopterin-guanine dinucleotide biosynthesis protein A
MRTAAILAGGRATRLGGRDKSALVVGDRTILSWQMDTLAAVDGVDEIVIVGHATHPSARTIADVVPGCGPLGGIHAALSEARHDTVFVLACDTPYVTASLVAYLFSLADGVDLVVPRTEEGYHPLCAVYARGCLDPIAQRLAAGRLTVIDLLADVRARIVAGDELERFGDPRQLFTNVNTPADYARCRPGLAALHDHKR